MVLWATDWFSQKSGCPDFFSSTAMSFSLPEMSKVHHRQVNPGLYFFILINKFLHLNILVIRAISNVISASGSQFSLPPAARWARRSGSGIR
jgi:hypothetical protein